MALIEGKNPVIEAIKGNRKINKIYLQENIEGKKITKILKEAKNKNIEIERISKEKLDKMATTAVPQGIIARAEEIKLYNIEDILNYASEKKEPPFMIILDQIQDPRNFGAIIRTALAAGVHGLVFPKDRQADITSAVLKTSAGAAEHLMLVKVANINYTIKKLKKEGLWIAGADLKGDIYYNTDLKGPLAIVIGNEGEGLRRLVRENCDFLVKIPMQNELNSLNASVAAGIFIYEVLRQRKS